MMHASRVLQLRRFATLFAAICPRQMYRPAVHNLTANVLLVRMTPNVKTASCVSVSVVLSASVAVSRALYVQTTRNVLTTQTTSVTPMLAGLIAWVYASRETALTLMRFARLGARQTQLACQTAAQSPTVTLARWYAMKASLPVRITVLA